MKKLAMKIGIFTAILFLWGCFLSPAQAASPSMYLSPETGSHTVGEEFMVDIMIDTDGEETQETKAVLSYDPDIIQVTAVSHSSIYCQYPDTGYEVDNSGGLLELTGFCQDDYYTTSNDADIFGRVTFKGMGNGTGEVEFVFDGTDNGTVTYMKAPGSPPLELDLMTPTGGSYTISGGTTTPTNGDLPGTGIWDNFGISIGISLILMAVLVLALDSILPRIVNWLDRRGQRTIVV